MYISIADLCLWFLFSVTVTVKQQNYFPHRMCSTMYTQSAYTPIQPCLYPDLNDPICVYYHINYSILDTNIMGHYG